MLKGGQLIQFQFKKKLEGEWAGLWEWPYEVLERINQTVTYESICYVGGVEESIL